MLDPGVWGRRDDAVGCISADILNALGPALLELPWPKLARLTGRDRDLDTAVTSLLAPALASDTGRLLFASASAAHTGTLTELVDAVTAALADPESAGK